MDILSTKKKFGACVYKEVQKISDEVILNKQLGLINLEEFYKWIISSDYYKRHQKTRFESYLSKISNQRKKDALAFEKNSIIIRAIKPAMSESIIRLSVKISDDYTLKKLSSDEDQNGKVDLIFTKKNNDNVLIVQVKSGKPVRFYDHKIVKEKIAQENRFGRTAEYLKVEFSDDDGSGQVNVLSVSHLNEISGETKKIAKFYSPDGNDPLTKEEMKKVLNSVYNSQLIKASESEKAELSSNFF